MTTTTDHRNNSRARDARLKLPVPDGEFWVFGYGSLMWKPGFEYAESRRARLYGYHRNLCVWSWHYRGTPEKPGLVFGLLRGGSCVGRAFRVEAAHIGHTVEYLHRREMITDVYRPGLRTVYLDDQHPVQSLVFIANNEHRQYAGKRAPHDVAGIISEASGPQGSNYEYVMQTAGQLDMMGIFDKSLHTLNRTLHTPRSRRNDRARP